MNDDLNANDQSIILAFSQHQIVKRVKLPNYFATIVKELSVRKRSNIRMESKVRKILPIVITSFNKEFSWQWKQQFFCNLRTENPKSYTFH